MAKIDLTSLEWRELIFQGKNKEYGAYQLRGQSNKRHNVAMLIVTIVALVGFSIPKLIEYAKSKQKITNVEVMKMSTLEKAEVKNDVKKIAPAEPPPALKSSIKFVAPVIAKDEEVKDDQQIKSQEELTNANVAISLADVKGNDEKNGKDIADIKENVTQEVEEKVWEVIEQMPQFPGGETELLSFIAKSIRYPVIAQENGIQGRVIIRFVVSKTGVVSNVEVLRSLDAACDKEAMRVVKTLPKWIPGKQNGVNVPVYYTLPITFRLQ
ncbi:MAG: energy transducer TonB [Paludibacter sp.]